MIKDRPLTVREIQEQKRKKRELEHNKVKVRNITKFQPVPLQVYGRASKDAVNQVTMFIGPGQSVEVPEYRLIPGQIVNLRKRRMISTHKVGKIEAGYKKFLPGSNKVDLNSNNKNFKNVSSKAKNKNNKNKGDSGPKTIDTE